MQTNDTSRLKGWSRDRPVSIARASIATLRRTARSLVATLGEQRAGAQKTGTNRTEGRTGQKPDGSVDPLCFEPSATGQLNDIDPNGYALVLDHPEGGDD